MKAHVKEWRVVFILARGGSFGVSTLSERLGLPKGTVQRALLHLREAGWPIVDEPDPRHSQTRRWRLDGKFTLPEPRRFAC